MGHADQTEASTSSIPPGRQRWLDLFRGLAVFAMCLVNYPGSWATVYWPLTHAAWHGVTPADFIFPAFLFAVGLSIVNSRLLATEAVSTAISRSIRRSAFLFAIGFALGLIPNMDLANARVMGVLQRVAVCYCAGALLYLTTGWRSQVLAATFLLVINFSIMTFVPVPHCHVPALGERCTLAAYLDHLLLGTEATKVEPEGLLSTIPALVTMMLGLLAGQWLQSWHSRERKLIGLVAAAVFGVTAGWAWHPWLPINKQLWTSSYVLVTGGMCCLLLALCYQLGRTVWTKAFEVLGRYALAAYVAAELGARVMSLAAPRILTDEGRRNVTLQEIVHAWLIAAWADPFVASLTYALGYACLILLLAQVFSRVAPQRRA